MAYSLLAHLFPYIKGSQEDIATFTLQYLLSQSHELNYQFTKDVAKLMNIQLEDELQYVCQVTGDSEEKERPDMVGKDSSGKETMLFEMKFYASLTKNQPNTYLDRLKKSDVGKGLMFICPAARITSLWDKLKELCPERTQVSEYCVDVSGIKMGIMSWADVIELLKQHASNDRINFTADVLQLEGYCNQLDSEAFIPFSADDLSAKTAIKEERYYMVVDEVIERLSTNDTLKFSKDGLKATAYRKGYSRRLKTDKYIIEIVYDRDLWKIPSSIETPFWIAITDELGYQEEHIGEYIKTVNERYKSENYGRVYLSLEAKQGESQAEVCDDIKNEILKYIRDIEELKA